jgi:hypothetical protein
MNFKEWITQKKSIFLTALGLHRSGFFTHYKYINSLPDTLESYSDVEYYFDSQREKFSQIIVNFSFALPKLKAAINEGSIPFEEKGMFPPIDTIAAYHIITKYRPNRILEIGSGASSHVLARALKDNGHGLLTCIDPMPRRSISETGAKIIPRVLDHEDIKIIDDFGVNDVLFTDSSHVMLPGMDVDIQFNRMFPRLPYGSIVHVHDIFLPEDYPSHWRHRNYSEQNALIGWIMSGFFEVLFPSFYVATRMESELRSQLGELMPRDPRKNAGSIWLRRNKFMTIET